ncbi:MAG: hypothetical protein ACFFFT_01640 [Candidatus Thorarchaeota archaeon]
MVVEEPNNSLLNSLKDKLPNMHIIGDCSEVKRIWNAIHEGYAIGNKLLFTLL